MTLATLVALAAEESEHGNVALETVGFGIIALAVFGSPRARHPVVPQRREPPLAQGRGVRAEPTRTTCSRRGTATRPTACR